MRSSSLLPLMSKRALNQRARIFVSDNFGNLPGFIEHLNFGTNRNRRAAVRS
jgi:hypothetical protein